MGAQAHHRNGDGGRHQVRGKCEQQSQGRGDPWAAWAEEQDRAGARDGEHARGVPARETQAALYGPADEGLEQDFGEGCGHRRGHSREHRRAPSMRRPAGHGQRRDHHDHRDRVTDRGDGFQQPLMPAQGGPDPVVNCHVQPPRPSLADEPVPQEHRDCHADDDERGGQRTDGPCQKWAWCRELLAYLRRCPSRHRAIICGEAERPLRTACGQDRSCRANLAWRRVQDRLRRRFAMG
jgi:hypothetical protein